jgi:hypothetical protein
MAQMSIDEIVKSIASETNTPPEVVLKLCEAAWVELSDGARIMDFLTVLVIKRVREDLRSGRRARNNGSAKQISLPPSDSKVDHDQDRNTGDRDQSRHADTPPHQTQRIAPECDEEHYSGTTRREAVHPYVRVARPYPSSARVT